MHTQARRPTLTYYSSLQIVAELPEVFEAPPYGDIFEALEKAERS